MSESENVWTLGCTAFPFILRHLEVAISDCCRLRNKHDVVMEIGYVQDRWRLAMYRTDGDWLCTGPVETGYVQGRWRLTMYRTDGDWLCTGPMEIGYVQDRWRLAMYRTDRNWLCTGPVEIGYVQGRWRLAMYRPMEIDHVQD
jgi:3'-phosphoadenosine 5'-phosphosulfate sulfotransferase (PAPS reductase)/FAD synthetase